ncbi:MAG: NAD(P)H-dependent oxidoreductase [Eubacterium sp.]|nr:NAD(P)H-dependent oxidoreductase [Eubacterium sp.]
MAQVLVAYFSATGTTGIAATALADAVGADLYEILPEIPYTNDDLNWRDEQSRSSLEMNDPSGRPAIGGEKIGKIEQYDTVFLCFPIWWYVAPTIVNTFLESYNMHGKKIVLMATSGGSGFGKTLERLEDSAPGAELTEGIMLNEMKSKEELKQIAEAYL